MCGIVGVAIKHTENNGLDIVATLFNLFRNQEQRGQQGCGIAIMRKGRIVTRFRQPDGKPINLFVDWINRIKNGKSLLEDGDLVLFHHRMPTSCGWKNPRNNHPIMNENKSIALIHNGMIYSDSELIRRHRKLGHRYETWNNDGDRQFNDSECLVHELEEQLKHHHYDMLNAVKGVFKMVDGWYAVGILRNKDNRIHLFANSAPIVLSEDSKGNQYFHSVESKSTHTIKHLSTGEYGILTPDGYSFKSRFTSPKKDYSISKRCYPNYHYPFGWSC